MKRPARFELNDKFLNMLGPGLRSFQNLFRQFLVSKVPGELVAVASSAQWREGTLQDGGPQAHLLETDGWDLGYTLTPYKRQKQNTKTPS